MHPGSSNYHAEQKWRLDMKLVIVGFLEYHTRFVGNGHHHPFTRRVKSQLPSASIIQTSPYFPH
jgi:hypothetical protein